MNSAERSKRRLGRARNSEIDTKARLLDAAERPFPDKGVEAVSRWDIALAAGVNLAAVNYHFGSRQEFIRAVIKRRAEAINARRLAALARTEQQAGSASVPTDEILEASLGPADENSNGRFHHFLWIGPATNPYRDHLINLMAPVLDRFAGALRRSLPAPSDEDCRRYLCSSIAILTIMLAGPRYLPGFMPSGENRMNESVITQQMIKLVCEGLNGQAM
jgi:AcrR family transcriptional regulator